MIPYVLLIGLPILVRWISARYRITLNRRVLLETDTAPMDLFMLIFLAMLALRGLECGTDTLRYSEVFVGYGNMSVSQILQGFEYERGFKLFAKLIYGMTDNFQIFLWITSVICVAPLWYFYRRESEDQILTIAIFLAVAPFIMYFSGIRQALAMSIGIPAWYAVKHGKPIRYLLLVFLAVEFHTSAFMLLTIYPLYRAKITKNWLWIVVPLMVVVFVFKEGIFEFLLRFLWEEYETTPETGATAVLILLIMFAVYAYLIPEDAQMDRDVIALRNILLLAIVIQFFAILHPLSMRMNYYFLLYVPILVPKIAARSKAGLRQITDLSVVVMTVYFLAFFISKMVRDVDSLNVFPYVPFWTA